MSRTTSLAAMLTMLFGSLSGPLAAQDLLYDIGEGGFSWDAYKAFADSHDYAGQTLNITAATTGEDAERYRKLYAYFTEATGAAVQYSGSESFEQDIVVAAEAGGLPDIALFPQPGLAKDLARRGVLQVMNPEIESYVRENFAAGDSWADLGRFEGPDGEVESFGIFFGTDVKSLVWYSPEFWREEGWTIPETMEELLSLSQEMVDDGLTPWCIGLGSGAATGWPATDWVEDMMLRTVPVDVYDEWTDHEIPFNDERVVNAIEQYGKFALNPDFTKGGPAAVATTDFRDSPDGLFDLPPKCYMHRQASFIPIFFPEDVVVGEDVEFFYFPPFEANADLGRPVLGSGGLAAITKESEIARGFIEFLLTPFAHEIMMSQGQFLTPHKKANLDVYATETQRALGEILTSATSFRFDGSDLMPGEIGTNAFWTGMVDYTTGDDAKKVADGIEERWRSIQ